MSALAQAPGFSSEPRRLHLVGEHEVSARSRRLAYAAAVARSHDWLVVRTYAGVGSMAVVFATALATLVGAFLAIPNTP